MLVVIACGNNSFSKSNKRGFSWYIEVAKTDSNLNSFDISVEIKEQQ
jgi:hypothetical protein